jgi:parallel beta-helix repeat protein
MRQKNSRKIDMLSLSSWKKKSFVFIVFLLFIGVSNIPATALQEARKNQSPSLTFSSCAKTIYVDIKNNEGPWDGSFDHPYCCIRDGIDAASDGDTVYVFSGEYPDPDNDPLANRANITKSISFIGEDKNTTIIVARHYHEWMVRIAADYVNVSGFTFRPFPNNWLDIKVHIINASYFTIRDTIFDDWGCVNTIHNIVMVGGSYNTITGNIIGLGWADIQNNSEGIHLIGSHHNSIDNNTIKGYHYGIYLSNSNENRIVDNILSSDHGVILESSSQNTISRNSIDNLCGIVLTKSSDNYITGNSFENHMIRNRRAQFTDSTNTWDQNYWGRPRLLPKIIVGYKTSEGKNRITFAVDWHPARESNSK